MIVITENILLTFARIQYYLLCEKYKVDQVDQKYIDELTKNILAACNNQFTQEEIEPILDKLLKEDPYKNCETIDKLLEMVQAYIPEEYENLNIDESGLDEADRMLIDVLESIGSLK